MTNSTATRAKHQAQKSNYHPNHSPKVTVQIEPDANTPGLPTGCEHRLACAAMVDQETNVGDLCRELGVTRQTLYWHVGPTGELREDGRKLRAVRFWP